MARKILLADDSVTAQNMGRKILTEAGYEVITVNNGSAALKKIAEQKPDLIILDVYMPGYGGLEVCQRLKESPETSRIPVLLTVGKLEPFKAEEAKRVRADMHIVKPFEVSELLTALTRLEDRIVAHSDAPRVGKFAKATEPEPESAPSIGGGWKSRLTGPRRKSKSAESKAAPKAEVQKSIAPETQPAEDDFANPVVTDWRSLLPAEEAKEAQLPQVQASAPEPAAEVVKVECTQEPAPSQISAEASSAPEAPASVLTEKSQEQDVADALATLAPAASAETGKSVAAGPRWVAQATAASDEETRLSLEQEMERAHSHSASSEPHDEAEAVSFAMGSPLIAAAVAEQTIPAPNLSFESAETEAAQTSQNAVAPESGFPPHEAASANEEPVAAISESKAQHSESPESTQGTAPAAGTIWLSPRTQHEPDAAESSERLAAMAAAAGSAETVISGQAIAPAMPVAEPAEPIIPEISNPQKSDSALASAWQSWRDERQPTNDVTVETQNAKSVAAETTGAEAATISSIVDTMLAELKPKLMEELARKMAKEKS